MTQILRAKVKKSSFFSTPDVAFSAAIGTLCNTDTSIARGIVVPITKTVSTLLVCAADWGFSDLGSSWKMCAMVLEPNWRKLIHLRRFAHLQRGRSTPETSENSFLVKRGKCSGQTFFALIYQEVLDLKRVRSHTKTKYLLILWKEKTS